MEPRLDIPPAPVHDVLRLARELGVPGALAQVLVRRGLADPSTARAFLAADARHDPAELAGMEAAVDVVLGHVRRGSRITVHGDYDVDGVCSTAVLVRTLRSLGADVDWYLPSRLEDGYGLNRRTVERLAARGTRLLLTADCAITAVDEVAAARALGLDVVVTDHHQPRADGALPDAPIVHPGLGGYPCPHLCAAGVALKVAEALLGAAGRDAREADVDLDLVALATVADCVPLTGENRRLVREGVRAIATTRRPGLRALMRVARVDPTCLTERDLGFRLAPRINAAGRLQRADAGLELVLTQDADRAAAVAAELEAANADRRHVETRILFEAEARLKEAGDRTGHVLWGEDWHPGVIGIVASRLTERHHRPVVLVALAGAQGTGSGRSIPAFDLLGGLDACAEHLLRHGGHRAAAGCTVARDALPAFADAFAAHCASVLGPGDLVPRERVDAVVAGDELGLELAEAFRALAPFGEGNREPSLLVPAAALADARPMGEEGRHIRFTVHAGGTRARAVAFGLPRLPAVCAGPVDATFALERNEWNGTVEPRLRLRHAVACAPAAVEVLGEPPSWRAAVEAELAAPPIAAAVAGEPPAVRDRRGGGVAGTLAALTASGERVLVVCADAAARRRHLDGRLGGFALVSWTALERDPALAAGHAHVAVLDPPACAAHDALLQGLSAGGATVHLAWGAQEAEFHLAVAERELELRATAAAVYRALRTAAGDAGGAGAGDAAGAGPGVAAEAALATTVPGAAAGRALRVLDELGLVALDRATLTVVVPPPTGRTELERSPTYRTHAARLDEARDRLARERAALERPRTAAA